MNLGFSLKLSPSKNLSTPLPSAISPTSSHGGSPVRSPAASATSRESRDYFSPLGVEPPKQVTQDEALKTVKTIENVLRAWNEYRVCMSATGKAGRKLAGALKDLSGHMDKTSVAAQTTRPTAVMLDNTADVMIKLARKVDKTYDEVNGDASRYFAFLAKETRSHDAYLGAITKRHDKAEKAYKKASKDLVETSHAHADILALKETLREDIARANSEHTALLSSKQEALLLRLASGSGALAEGVTSFFSEGLRKSAHGYRDLEYFRALADARWLGTLPADLETEEEERKRDAIRLAKVRVAMGEAEVLGPHIWAAEPSSTSGARASNTSTSSPLRSVPPVPVPSLSASSTTSRTSAGSSVTLVTNTLTPPESTTHDRNVKRALPMTPTNRAAQVRHVSADPRYLSSHTVDWLGDPTVYPYPSMRPDHPLPSPTRGHSRDLPKPPFDERRQLGRRTVGQIAGEMEAHQRHDQLEPGCELCAGSRRESRRVTLPVDYERGVGQTL